MSHAVTEAMIESYALMILVMLTFFVYFCGMVWAFCNPKLSGIEEEVTAGCESDFGRTDEIPVQQVFHCPGQAQGTRDWRDVHTTDSLSWTHSCGSPVFVEQSSSHTWYINSSYDVD